MKPTHFLLGAFFAFAAGGCLPAALTGAPPQTASWLAVIALLLAAASELQTAFSR